MDNFAKINYEDSSFNIDKNDSLKTLLTREELLQLPMSIWKDIFELKDGICSANLLILVLEASIRAYDKSKNVNIFYYNNKGYWLDKATRVGLQNLTHCCPDKVSLILEDIIVDLTIDKAAEFLSLLELYAGKCFIQTAKHLLSIKSLKTVEDIVNYNYTTGYPDKITLNE